MPLAAVAPNVPAPQVAPPPEWLTPEQAAEHVQLSPRTLKRWRSKGGGPPFARFGRDVRYSRAALDRWMHGRASSEPRGDEGYRPSVVRTDRDEDDDA